MRNPTPPSNSAASSADRCHENAGTGGGGRLKGLDRYLAANLGVAVESFDPFEGLDCSAVDDELDEAPPKKADEDSLDVPDTPENS